MVKAYLREHEDDDIQPDKDYEMKLHTEDRQKLWGLAAAKCSMCKCDLFLKEELNESDTKDGEECHISSHRPDHPSESFSRYIPNLTEVERDKKYENAILLCGRHHKVIDNPKNTQYTIRKLHQIKAEHEAWVTKKLGEDTKESKEFKKRIEEVERKIEIYEFELKLNKKRFEWTKNKIENKIREIAEKTNDVNLEDDFRPILCSSTTKYLEESLEEHGGETDELLVSCPDCGANLWYDPDSDLMYCRRCKKYVERI